MSSVREEDPKVTVFLGLRVITFFGSVGGLRTLVTVLVHAYR